MAFVKHLSRRIAFFFVYSKQLDLAERLSPVGFWDGDRLIALPAMVILSTIPIVAKWRSHLPHLVGISSTLNPRLKPRDNPKSLNTRALP